MELRDEAKPAPIGLTLAALSFGMFAVGTTSLVVLGLAGPIVHDFRAAPGMSGALIAVFAFTFAVSAPLMQSLLGGRLSGRMMIVGGLLVLSLGSFGGALSGRLTELLASRALAALGGALMGPSAAATAAGLVKPERRGRALATVFAGFTLASVMGVPLATWLGQLLGWRGAIAGIGVLGLSAALAAAATLRFGAPSSPTSLRALRDLLTGRRVAAGLGVSVLHLMAQFTLFALMGLLLVDHFRLTEGYLPIALLGFGLAGVAGNAVAGAMTDRCGPGLTITLSFGGLALVGALLCLPLPALTAAGLLAVAAGFGTMYAAPQQVFLSGLAPEKQRGTILALNSSAGYIGLAGGSALAALVERGLGYGALGAASLAASLLGLVLFQGLSRSR